MIGKTKIQQFLILKIVHAYHVLRRRKIGIIQINGIIEQNWFSPESMNIRKGFNKWSFKFILKPHSKNVVIEFKKKRYLLWKIEETIVIRIGTRLIFFRK